MELKDERLRDEIKRLSAEFMQRESNRTSLITITDVQVRNKGKVATVFFTVLPESMEKSALDFAKRMRSDFREYVKDHSRIMRIPFFEFAIDGGEKNRQRIDEISNEQQ